MFVEKKERSTMGLTDILMKVTGSEVPKKMKSSVEMSRYFCYYHKTIPKCVDIMRAVEESLEPDEYVIHCFEGKRIVERVQWNVFYAFTEKRILFGAEKQIFSPLTAFESFFKNIMYNDIVEMKINDNTIIIKYNNKEERCICYREESINELEKRVLPLIQQRNTSEKKEPSTASPITEIRKFKELLDEGIITEEEFQKKKKELLNL